MNGRSSLVFLAHLLGNHRLASSSPSTPTPLCGFSFLSQAPPSVGSPYPLPIAGPPAPSAGSGGGSPVTFLLPKPTGHHQGNRWAGRWGGLPTLVA